MSVEIIFIFEISRTYISYKHGGFYSKHTSTSRELSALRSIGGVLTQEPSKVCFHYREYDPRDPRNVLHAVIWK